MNKIIIFIAIGAVMALTQNCARIPLLGTASDSNETSQASTEPIQSPYGLITGEQALQGMLKVTGVALTGGITNEFNARNSAFSSGPDLKQTTSPMMVAFTSMGGEVCNQLVANEAGKAAADRSFFGSVDFTKPIASVSAGSYDEVVRAFSRNFWGRNETAEEKSMLLDGKADFVANFAANRATSNESTRDLLVFTCAAMISSFDSVTY